MKLLKHYLSLMILPIIFITSISTGSGCAFTKYARLMEPPVETVDVAELAANVPEGYELIFLFGGESVQPESSVVNSNANEMTVQNAMQMIDFGSALGQDEKSIAADALRDAVNKNRRYPMQVHIIQPADDPVTKYSKTVEITKSFNESALKPGKRSLTNANQLDLDLQMAEINNEKLLRQLKELEQKMKEALDDVDMVEVSPDDDGGNGSVTNELPVAEGTDKNLIKESTNDDGSPSGRGVVVLVRSSWTGKVKSVKVGNETFNKASVANGNREHYRPPSGRSLNEFVNEQIVLELNDGRKFTHTVSGKRDDGFKWKEITSQPNETTTSQSYSDPSKFHWAASSGTLHLPLSWDYYKIGVTTGWTPDTVIGGFQVNPEHVHVIGPINADRLIVQASNKNNRYLQYMFNPTINHHGIELADVRTVSKGENNAIDPSLTHLSWRTNFQNKKFSNGEVASEWVLVK